MFLDCVVLRTQWHLCAPRHAPPALCFQSEARVRKGGLQEKHSMDVNLEKNRLSQVLHLSFLFLPSCLILLSELAFDTSHLLWALIMSVTPLPALCEA